MTLFTSLGTSADCRGPQPSYIKGGLVNTRGPLFLFASLFLVLLLHPRGDAEVARRAQA